jgi:hypothetical protein
MKLLQLKQLKYYFLSGLAIFVVCFLGGMIVGFYVIWL